MEAESLRLLAARAGAFRSEAHRILAEDESSPSRVITLSDTYSQLSTMTLRQDALFRQALDCTTHGFFRAAHVLGWAGFMGFLQDRMSSDGLVAVNAAFPAWSLATLEDLRDSVVEHQQIEACKKVKLINKATMKVLLGLLSQRNECAHPGSAEPTLNETLGFLSTLIRRSGDLQTKSPSYP